MQSEAGEPRASTRRDAPCPLCGTGPTVEVLRGADPRYPIPGDYGVLWCPRCLVAATHPMPSPTELEEHYPPDYDPFRPTGGDNVGSRWRRVLLDAEGKLKPIIAGAPDRGSLLDVGCGNGDFMALLAARGVEVLGVDASPLAAAEVARRGMRAVTGDFLQVALPPESFDGIAMNHVLEHLRDPRAGLRKAWSLLKPGGRLLLGVPNFASVERSHFGPAWSDLELPRHLFHFTARGLRRLLTDEGFQVERLRADPTADANSILTSLGVRHRKRDDPLLARAYPFLHAALYPVGFPLALVGRSAWIRVTARKPVVPHRGA